jgi:hypothetical protein
MLVVMPVCFATADRQLYLFPSTKIKAKEFRALYRSHHEDEEYPIVSSRVLRYRKTIQFYS